MNSLAVLIGILGVLWLTNYFYVTVGETTLGLFFMVLFFLLLAWLLHAVQDDISAWRGRNRGEDD